MDPTILSMQVLLIVLTVFVLVLGFFSVRDQIQNEKRYRDMMNHIITLALSQTRSEINRKK